MPVRPEPTTDAGEGVRSRSAEAGDDDGKDEIVSADDSRVQDQVIEAPGHEEDTEQQRSLKAPETPTSDEVADHIASGHLPYRSWCPDCVEAFGRERPHGHSETRSIPLVSCDYLFLTPRGPLKRGELTEEELSQALKVLVVYCGATRSIFAHAVPKNGIDNKGYIVEQSKQDILWLGHAKVVLKGDNGPALVQVIMATVAALKASGVSSATEEGSVPYDPQINGAAEAAVRLFKSTIRANLLSLERQIKARVPIDHPVVAWLVRYSATVRTLRIKGTDGKTAHQRVKGSSSIVRLIPFGEVCRYKSRAQEGGIGGSAWRWSSGVWLGIERRTGQYVVYDKTMGGIRTARTILRMPQPQQWSLDAIRGIEATPWSIHEPNVPEVVHHQPSSDITTKERVAQVRRVYIRQEDLDRHGYTKGCKRCQNILVYGPKSSTVPHTDECRDRIMAEFAKTEQGRVRLARMNERADRFIAEHMRQQIEGTSTAVQGRDDGGQAHVPQDVPQSAPPFDFVPLDPVAPGNGPDLGHDSHSSHRSSDPVPPERSSSGETNSGPTLGHDGANLGPALGHSGNALEGASRNQSEDVEMEVGITAEEEEVDLRKLLAVYAREARAEAKRNHEDMIALVTSLGANGRAYRREATKRLRAIVSEIYSAPRVTAMAKRRSRLGVIPGIALDLTVHDEDGKPWDFNDPQQRRNAEQLLDEQRPLLLIGTPMCTAFSNIQNLNKASRDPEVVRAELEKARVHLQWCCRLYQKQLDRGAYFLHEHPAGATSWKTPEIAALLAHPLVDRIVADQCQFGQQTDSGDPLRKPTGFMSNAPHLLARLSKRCFGKGGLCTRPRGGRHAECLGKKAQRAAIFQDELCMAILRGFKDQLAADRRTRNGEVGVVQDQDGVMMSGDDEVAAAMTDAANTRPDLGHGGDTTNDPLEHVLFTPRWDKFVDDLTGLPLPPELCREARRKEIQYFRDKGVWDIRKISEARVRMGKRPITVRWVETNKGDDAHPNMRSRLVARDRDDKARRNLCAHGATRVTEDDPQHGVDVYQRLGLAGGLGPQQ